MIEDIMLALREGRVRRLTKAFPKTPERIVTVTIEEDGSMTYLATDSADIFMECGETITRRASHVEPATLLPRIAFHILRRFVTDKSRIAAWTRTWGCMWRVNTAPVSGPILTWEDVDGFPKSALGWDYILDRYKAIAVWRDRQKAIDAEVKFLNTYFATRGEKVR